jgi:hypothetical protein
VSAVMKLEELTKPFTTLKEAEAIAGPLGTPSKMPGLSYGIPASLCKVGGALQKVPGSVCSKCYALKGHYVHNSTKIGHARRVRGLQHPRWVDAMVFMIRRAKCDYFRWHDSGDVQDMAHLLNIVAVCRRCPSTKFWLPTREIALIKRYQDMGCTFPKNLVVRVSAAMIDEPAPQGFRNTSTVVRERPMFGHVASCPAQFNDNKCGKCRQCWDGRVKNVSYPLH